MTPRKIYSVFCGQYVKNRFHETTPVLTLFTWDVFTIWLFGKWGFYIEWSIEFLSIFRFFVFIWNYGNFTSTFVMILGWNWSFWDLFSRKDGLRNLTCKKKPFCAAEYEMIQLTDLLQFLLLLPIWLLNVIFRKIFDEIFDAIVDGTKDFVWMLHFVVRVEQGENIVQFYARGSWDHIR